MTATSAMVWFLFHPGPSRMLFLRFAYRCHRGAVFRPAAAGRRCGLAACLKELATRANMRLVLGRSSDMYQSCGVGGEFLKGLARAWQSATL